MSDNPEPVPGSADLKSISAAWSPKFDEVKHATSRGLVFLVNGQAFAISVDFIEKVIEFPDYTVVPGASEWFMGMVGYEGEALALMDVEGFLYRKPVKSGSGTRAILVNCAHGRLLLAVQQIVTLCELASKKKLMVAPAEIPDTCVEYVCQQDDGPVVVLNMAAFLTTAQGSSSTYASASEDAE